MASTKALSLPSLHPSCLATMVQLFHFLSSSRSFNPQSNYYDVSVED